jgi:hypothetical protein
MSERAAVPAPRARPSAEALATVLPAALELMTAYTSSGSDPRFFWDAMRRVVGESLTGADPARAVAELLFGLSAVGGILLEQLAEAVERSPHELLHDLHRDYLTGPAT